MPSFKERFRPSRKYKKNKEASGINTDESATIPVASGISTNPTNVPATGGASPTTGTTADEHTGSAALSTYQSHYSSDQCE